MSPFPQSAAEYVKSRLPEVLKQHLQDYERDKENSVLSYQSILEQQILSIDREMLEKLAVSYDEAGMAGIQKSHLPPQKSHLLPQKLHLLPQKSHPHRFPAAQQHLLTPPWVFLLPGVLQAPRV